MIIRRQAIKILKTVLLLFFSLFCLLAFLEITSIVYVRITKEELPPLKESFDTAAHSLHLFDEELGFRLKPGYSFHDVRVNSLGFRSTQEFNFKTENKTIILLGDSMVFGVGISQDYIFSELLNREHSTYRYINAGVIGYDTAQEYLVLKKYIDKIQPAAVILFFEQSNDMLMNVRGDNFYPKASIQNGRLIIQKAIAENPFPFYQRFIFYQLMNTKMFKGRDLIYLYHKLMFTLFKERSEAWIVTKRLLFEIAELCDLNKAQLIIVDIPTQNQLKFPQLYSRETQKLLQEAAKERGIAYYDLMVHYPDWQKLFIPRDSHWNIEGHRFMNEFVKKISE